MQEDDVTRLGHMLDAAREAVSFGADRTRQDVETNRMLALALVKCLEIVGEAASQVSAEGRAALPQLPWRLVIGMRNRLIHGYFDVDYNVVWDTVTRNLPPLIAQLEQVLANENQSP
jgi:uncharacterized protein with HEPN domain